MALDIGCIVQEASTETVLMDENVAEFVVELLRDELSEEKGFISEEVWSEIKETALTEVEFLLFKEKICKLLEENEFITKQEEEPFPEDMKCNGFFEDNWYPCTIVKIVEPCAEYNVVFDGYEDNIETLDRKSLEHFPEKLKTKIKVETNNTVDSNLDPFAPKIELEEVPEWYFIEIEEPEDEELPPGACPLCERILPLSFHHLRPRCIHEMYIKRKGFTKDELNKGIDICRACHSAVHRLHPNEELAETFYTLELLLEDEPMQKWIKYISKQKLTKHTGSDLKKIIQQN